MDSLFIMGYTGILLLFIGMVWFYFVTACLGRYAFANTDWAEIIFEIAEIIGLTMVVTSCILMGLTG